MKEVNVANEVARITRQFSEQIYALEQRIARAEQQIQRTDAALRSELNECQSRIDHQIQSAS